MIPVRNRSLILLFALGGILLWAYWVTLAAIAEKWSTAQYSHGYLVPVFSLVLLWLRRDQIASGELRPSSWGLLPLALGCALRLAGTYFYMEYLEALSLLPCLVGLALCMGGKPALRWSLPAIGFLFFMLPFPYRLEIMMGGPLRRIAVVASNYALQTMGFAAVAEGNIIWMEHGPIAVEEACSGLSMLLTFFALSTGLALVTKRPLLDKVVVVLSALPIAIVANMIRIVATATIAETIGPEVAHLVFHDLAGWLMMPLALCMLGLEMALLSRLLLESTAAEKPSIMTWDGVEVDATAPMPAPGVNLHDPQAAI